MRRDRVLAHCTAQNGAAHDSPFGDDVAVFEVGAKVLALVSLGGEPGPTVLTRR